jgi:hypothetical protein
MKKIIKTYEEWYFNNASNQDIPAVGVDQELGYPKRFPDPEATRTLITDPDDEFQYPNKIIENTHGMTSHAIKHMWEFDPNLYKQLIRRTKDILKKYIDSDDMKIINKKGAIEDDIYEDEDIDEMSLYNIINALDFIQDKTFKKMRLNEIENRIQTEIILPLRREYKKLIENILQNAVRIEDYKPEMENRAVYFNGDNGRDLLYYDPNIKGLMVVTKDKERVFTLFGISKNDIHSYFASLNPGSKKTRPSKETLQLLRNYER